MATKTRPVRSNYGTVSAMRAASFLRNAVVRGEDPFNSLTPYYIAAACAQMEGALNNCFVEYLHQKLGQSYSQHLRPFLFMKVQDRMELAPLLLSDFKFKLNDKHDLVKRTLRLFDMRNHLLHIKDLWHYAEVEYGSDGSILNMEFLIKDHPDPYRGDAGINIVAQVQIEEVEDIVKRFTKRFSTMPNSIKRKNFKPDAWLAKVQRT